MKVVKILPATALVCAAGLVAAAEIGIGDRRLATATTGDTLVPSTAEVDSSLPSTESGSRIFHFDATQTANWQFSDEAKTKVSRVPSLVGERYAYLARSDASWTASTWPTEPELVSDPDIGGRPCLDFGVSGSGKGLVFNSVSASVNASVPAEGGEANILENIGTVFMVINSENGGGSSLLGGGGYWYDSTHWSDCVWKRGTTTGPSGVWDWTDYTIPNARWYGGGVWDISKNSLYNGIIREDGIPTVPRKIGLSGGWQQLTIVPTAADLNACGFGIGCTYNGSTTAFSGGQKLAEVIIYDSILPIGDIERIERYLRKKWFGSSEPGYGGNSRVEHLRGLKEGQQAFLENGAVVKIDVPEGESMSVGRYMGGRGVFPALVKRGAGTLRIDDIKSYQGTLKLDGGTLAFDLHEIPDSLPRGVLHRFDASLPETLVCSEENGVKYVTSWIDATGRRFKTKETDTVNGLVTVAAGTLAVAGNYPTRDFRPWLDENAFGGTGTVVDYGPDWEWGRSLELFTRYGDGTTGSYGNLKIKGNVTTVICVMNAHGRGAFPVGQNGGSTGGSGNYFEPSAANSGYTVWDGQKLADYAMTTDSTGFTGTNTLFMVDGLRREPTGGYATPGWQVFAMQCPGANVNKIGGGWSEYYGAGCELAEVVMYDRMLTERELLDAQAYLSRKWFNREIPGYRRCGERAETDDVAKLEVLSSSTIHVPAGQTVRIGSLEANAELVKTGAGTLEIRSSEGAERNLVVQEGSVVGVKAPSVDENVPAVDPALWLDAVDISGSSITEVNGEKRVRMWLDKTGRNCACQVSTGNMPNYVADGLNSLPTVDFLGYDSWRLMQLGTPLDSVRTIFAVGDYYAGGAVLGTWSDGDFVNTTYDFLREAKVGAPILKCESHNYQTWGEGASIFVDGVATNYTYCPPQDEYHLIEMQTMAGCHGSSLMVDNAASHWNGGKLAEIIVYERVLTPREKIATRNYLMKKWFNAEPVPLPEEEAAGAVGCSTMDVAGTVSVTNEAAATYSALSGDGTLAKNGSGVLSIENIGEFTGTVDVRSGGLRLSGAAADATVPAMAQDGLIARFAADEDLAVEENDNGLKVVTRWESTVGDGLYATTNSRGYAYLLSDSLNGRPVVKMDESFDYVNANYMVFRDSEDRQVYLDGMRTVLWVIGSQEGGGYLMAGGTNSAVSAASYNFHRGGSAGFAPSDPLLSPAADARLINANWYVNGKEIDPMTSGLSGGWDVVGMVMSGEGDYTRAEGFAADGRSIRTGDYTVRAGRQRLAEVLVYDRRLSDAERRATEMYLRTKWGVRVPAASEENALKVNLAEGTVLDMGEQTFLAGISGAGTVEGDLTAGGFTADYGARDSFVVVNGTLSFPEEIKVDVKGDWDSDWLPLVQAEEYAGTDNLRNADFGDLTGRLRLRIRKGVLGVDAEKGLHIMVR